VVRKPLKSDHSCRRPVRGGDKRYGMKNYGLQKGTEQVCLAYSENSLTPVKKKIEIVVMDQKNRPPYTGPYIAPEDLEFTNKKHIAFLRSMHIYIQKVGGEIRLLYYNNKESDYEQSDGYKYMQKLQAKQHAMKDGDDNRGQVYVQVFQSKLENMDGSPPFFTVKAGPAAFGPDLDEDFLLTEAHVVHTEPQHGCTKLENAHAVRGKIVLMQRGSCMFVEKVRLVQQLGAVGAVIYNQRDGDTDKFFTMSGDGTDDVSIPSAFVTLEVGVQLRDYLLQGRPLFVSLSGLKWEEPGTSPIT